MNRQTQRCRIAGPAGAIECAVDDPPEGRASAGCAVLCHPHPQHGGTLDNKVVQMLARAAVHLGLRAVRFNFRGVGGSEGAWDGGRGEVDDALAVLAAFGAGLPPSGAEAAPDAVAPALSAMPPPALPLALLGGFSFGGYVAAAAAQRLHEAGQAAPQRLVLVAPAVQNFPVPAVSAQTLVVHGEADDVVPLAAVLDWARPQALPVVVVPGAGHFFHGQITLLKNLVLAHRAHL